MPNPVDGVPKRREADPEIRFLSLDEIDEQLGILEPYPQLQTMVALYIYAGLRLEEALWLTPRDVVLDAGMIRVQHKTVAGQPWRPKTRKNRRIPISKALRRYLDAYERPACGLWYFVVPEKAVYATAR